MRGTWQTADSGAGPVAAVVVVLLLAGSGAVAAVAAALAWVLAAVAVLTVAAAGAGAWWLVRVSRRIPPPRWQQVPGAAPARELPARQQPAIVNNYFGGQHVHGADVSPVIRQALTDRGEG